MKRNEIEDFPEHIVKRMLDYQEAQGNPRDVTVFKKDKEASHYGQGFDWENTDEGEKIWDKVINYGEFHLIPNNNYPKLMEVETSPNDWVKRVVILERTVGVEKYYYYVPYAETFEKALETATLYFTKSVREIPVIPTFTKAEICKKLGVTDFKIVE